MKSGTRLPLLSSGPQIFSPLRWGGMTPSFPTPSHPLNPQGSDPAVRQGQPKSFWKCWSQLLQRRASPSWPPEERQPQAFSWGKERPGSLRATRSGLGSRDARHWDRWGPSDKGGGCWATYQSEWAPLSSGSLQGTWGSSLTLTRHRGPHKLQVAISSSMTDGAP